MTDSCARVALRVHDVVDLGGPGDGDSAVCGGDFSFGTLEEAFTGASTGKIARQFSASRENSALDGLDGDTTAADPDADGGVDAGVGSQ